MWSSGRDFDGGIGNSYQKEFSDQGIMVGSKKRQNRWF
nr:MAG TPA: hypothetical protein [Caudoviricetes sp.]